MKLDTADVEWAGHKPLCRFNCPSGFRFTEMPKPELVDARVNKIEIQTESTYNDAQN